MAHTNVSSCVLSIVGSFSSGLDVFKKLREKRQRKRRKRREGKKCNDIVEAEELQLSRSLRQGPEDIGREYARSVYAVGEGYAVGDGPAQASLAEILLKLNTGLVGIISSFLSSEKRDEVQPDYRALTQISDRSRIDTCRALRQLFSRMTQPQPLLALTPASDQRQELDKPRRKRKASSGHTRVKGPMLARVVIENSSKPSQIAMVKPSERRKKSSPSSSSELSKAPSTPSTPPPEYAPEPPPRPVAVRAKTAPGVPKVERKQGSNLCPKPAIAHPDQHPAAHSMSRLPSMGENDFTSFPTALHPDLVLLPSQLNMNPAAQSSPALVHRTRKPTPTYYSIASDSTRLGEIPLHKWNVPYDFDRMSILNREAEKKGWPANDIGADENVAGRRTGWGLRRLFGKK